jgi:hypothetical protein
VTEQQFRRFTVLVKKASGDLLVSVHVDAMRFIEGVDNGAALLALRIQAGDAAAYLETLGIPREAARNWFTSNGQSANRCKADAKEKIFKRVEAGETQKQVAADYGISQQQVSNMVAAEHQRAEGKADEKEELAAFLSRLTADVHTGIGFYEGLAEFCRKRKRGPGNEAAFSHAMQYARNCLVQLTVIAAEFVLVASPASLADQMPLVMRFFDWCVRAKQSFQKAYFCILLSAEALWALRCRHVA